MVHAPFRVTEGVEDRKILQYNGTILSLDKTIDLSKVRDRLLQLYNDASGAIFCSFSPSRIKINHHKRRIYALLRAQGEIDIPMLRKRIEEEIKEELQYFDRAIQQVCDELA